MYISSGLPAVGVQRRMNSRPPDSSIMFRNCTGGVPMETAIIFSGSIEGVEFTEDVR